MCAWPARARWWRSARGGGSCRRRPSPFACANPSCPSAPCDLLAMTIVIAYGSFYNSRHKEFFMPMIQLTVPAGVLTVEARRGLQKALAATLLKWEGAPDTAFFRAQAWSRIDEVSGDGFTALEDDAPRFRLDVTVPEGGLSQRRKDGLVKEATEQVLA